MNFSPELRETRLRVRVDELREQADKLREQNRYLRRKLERKDIRILAMRRDILELQKRVRSLENPRRKGAA